MKLTYEGPQPAVTVAVPEGRPVRVARGESIELPSDIAKALKKDHPDIWTTSKSSGKTKNDPVAETEED